MSAQRYVVMSVDEPSWREDETGLSLVEMMVAVMILAVALLALIAVFGSTAASVQSQRNVTGATRVASDSFEKLRAMPWACLEQPAPAGCPAPQTSATVNGVAYSITNAIVDEDLDGDTSTTTEDVVKRVTVTVAWNQQGQAREESFVTAIAENAEAAATSGPSTIGEISLFPVAVDLDADGRSVSNVTATVPVTNVAYGDLVTLSWTDDNGAHSLSALYTSGGTVSFSLPAGSITYTISDDRNSEDLELIAAVDVAEKLATLRLQRQPTQPLTLSEADVSPDVIWVGKKKNDGTCSGNFCTNIDPITFTVKVTGFDETQNVDSVRVRFRLADGRNEEVVLSRDATDLTKWTRTFPKNSFALDAPEAGVQSRDFTFIAIRLSSDGYQVSQNVTANVARQS